MDFIISILVVAAIITAWAFIYSKWPKARGGCGGCSAFRKPNDPACGCGIDRQTDEESTSSR